MTTRSLFFNFFILIANNKNIVLTIFLCNTIINNGYSYVNYFICDHFVVM